MWDLHGTINFRVTNSQLISENLICGIAVSVISLCVARVRIKVATIKYDFFLLQKEAFTKLILFASKDKWKIRYILVSL